MKALEEGKIAKGQVLVIRYEGPKGGPGMPEMLTPTSAIMGAGSGKGCCPDHRRPLFRRLARIYRWPCHARSPGGRPDRLGAHRRRASPSTPGTTNSLWRYRMKNWPPPQGLAHASLQGRTRHTGQVHPQRQERRPWVRNGRVGYFTNAGSMTVVRVCWKAFQSQGKFAPPWLHPGTKIFALAGGFSKLSGVTARICSSVCAV